MATEPAHSPAPAGPAPATLPRFATLRDRLPAPIFSERPDWVALYWRAWELACRNFHLPAVGSGFVAPFIDAAFNQNIFLWDTCFLTMFCNVAHPLVPGIGSLDNFYAKQHPDGEICREIDRQTGRDFAPWVNREGRPLFSRWGWGGLAGDLRDDPVDYRGRPAPATAPRLTLDALNHPLLAWAEWESYRVTGDRDRLARVYDPLVRYYRALQHYLRQGNGLYVTDWASMDNSPRNLRLRGGGCGVDSSSEMALGARTLAAMAGELGDGGAAGRFGREADELSRAINAQLWDPVRRFYFDLTLEGQRIPIRTVAGFWPLLAGVAGPDQAQALAEELDNPATFRRPHRVPTLAANEPGYDPAGGYWCGAVWAPTTTMVIRGLERYGFAGQARDIALNHLEFVGRVDETTGTIWENYAAETAAPGRPAQPDFVGWSGLGPICYLLEFAVGLQPDAAANTLRWRLATDSTVGCDRYRFNGQVLSLRAEPGAGRPESWRVTVHAERACRLELTRGGQTTAFAIAPGANSLGLS